MQEFKYVIQDLIGVHARPAGLLCQEAKKYKSLSTLTFKGETVKLSQLMAIMQLGICKDDEIIIRTEGLDEGIAAADLEAFLKTHL